ncbi:oxygenase MpaB family protein [Williamsia maris]|uniref:Uncharacterized conserved protein, DUF2236 family n=1 Tax=Williamsia maris TaxID=72806 RepID=A0ABT1HHL3_9NOCA|nr:oxygenase MpaB family protein [Williamsia maris]MCP2177726.1 Uncharacterized conserved protein, DUF2236 family [Williamsia maris]
MSTEATQPRTEKPRRSYEWLVDAGYRIRVHTAPRPTGTVTRLADSLETMSAFAGAANVVMQLSDRAVGHGVVESRVHSGAVTEHPIKRARTTFTYLAVAVLGSDTDREVYRTAVNRQHRQVRSTEASPVRYNAFDRNLQLWVAMCLYVGFEDTHLILRGAMSARQRAVFYSESAPLATTLQVTPDMWPATVEDFDDLWVARVDELTLLDERLREYLGGIIDLSFVPVPRPVARYHRFVTVGMLAPRFRDIMGLSWSDRDDDRFAALMRAHHLLARAVPGPLRGLGYRALLADMRLRVRHGRALV